MVKKKRISSERPTRWGWPAVLGIGVAVLSILVPILWDRYRSTTSLLLEEVSATPIINTEQTPEELTVAFRGTEVENLSNYTFRLQNTGSTPIRSADVVEYPSINFPSARVFDVRLLDQNPKELGVELKQDNPTARGTRVRLVFPLLNPDDWVTFSILLSPEDRPVWMPDEPIYEASTRITGMTGLDVLQKTAGSPIAFDDLSWTVYVAAFGSFIVMMMFFSSMSTLDRQIKMGNAWEQGKLKLPTANSWELHNAFVDLIFKQGGETFANSKPVYEMLEAFPPGVPISHDDLTELSAEIKRALTKYGVGWIVVLITGAISFGGWLYVLRSIVSF